MRSAALAVLFGLSGLLLAAGCKGTVVTPGSGSGKDEPSRPAILIPCPETTPDYGPCEGEGQVCGLQVSGCEIRFTCVGGEWSSPESSCTEECGAGTYGSPCLELDDSCTLGSECGGSYWYCTAEHTWSESIYDDPCCYEECQCDPYYCPPSPPAEGDYCDPCYDSYDCGYELFTTCGPKLISASCGDDYAWHVQVPPPCTCGDHPTVEECQADPECRYLSGGCDEPTLSAGGCFPAADCSVDNPCSDGAVCTTVNANDCGLDACVECIAANLCL